MRKNNYNNNVGRNDIKIFKSFKNGETYLVSPNKIEKNRYNIYIKS